MTSTTPAAARERAFTIMEVMAALMIFVTGVVGVLALFMSGLALHRDAQHQAAVALASDEVRARVETWLSRVIEEGADNKNVELPKMEDQPIDAHPGYFYSATLSVDPLLGAQGGVLARVFVYTVDVGKEKGDEFTMFVRSGARPENQIRRALGIGVQPAPPPNEAATPLPSGNK
jgi:hypothetical protein